MQIITHRLCSTVKYDGERQKGGEKLGKESKRKKDTQTQVTRQQDIYILKL